MGRAAGVSRRRKKNKNPKFKSKTKLKKEKAALQRHRYAKVQNKCLQANWDKSKTVQENMEQMGLVYDPNKLLGIPKSYQRLGLPDPNIEEEVNEVMDLGRKKKTKGINKKHVVETLEKEAAKERPKLFKFGPELSKFIVTMVEKHGSDFEAMQRDRANVYQYSAGYIKTSIKKFMKIPTNRKAYELAVESVNQEMEEQ